MACYAVVYETKNVDAQARFMAEVLKTESTFISASSYAICTDERLPELTARLRRHIDDEDILYVFLTQAWDGWGPSDSVEWLGEHFGVPEQR